MKGMTKIRLFYSGAMALILPKLKDSTNFVLKLICSLYTLICLSVGVTYDFSYVLESLGLGHGLSI